MAGESDWPTTSWPRPKLPLLPGLDGAEIETGNLQGVLPRPDDIGRRRRGRPARFIRAGVGEAAAHVAPSCLRPGSARK